MGYKSVPVEFQQSSKKARRAYGGKTYVEKEIWEKMFISNGNQELKWWALKRPKQRR